MRHPFIHLRPLVGAAALLLMLSAPAPVRAQPDPLDRTASPTDPRLALRPQARALLRDASALRRRDPKRAIALLDAFFAKKPPLTSDVALLIRLRADIQLEDLKDAGGALDTYDYAREWNAAADPPLPAWAQVELLAGEAQTLLANKKAAGAVEVLQTGWPVIVASNRNREDYAWRRTKEAAQTYFKALDKAGRKTQAPDVLAQHLLASPSLLAFAEPEGDLGTLLLRELSDRLVKAKRPEEAASWGRLSYMTCAYSAPALESATLQLARAWNNREQTRAFGRAQTDAEAPNPLDAIAQPTLGVTTRQTLEQRVRELESTVARARDAEQTSDLIGLYLASERFGEAMELAWGEAQAEPDAPQGAAQVCRVFKAADLDLVRAHAFLDWTQQKGENPVPNFLQQHRAGAPL